MPRSNTRTTGPTVTLLTANAALATKGARPTRKATADKPAPELPVVVRAVIDGLDEGEWTTIGTISVTGDGADARALASATIRTYRRAATAAGLENVLFMTTRRRRRADHAVGGQRPRAGGRPEGAR